MSLPRFTHSQNQTLTDTAMIEETLPRNLLPSNSSRQSFIEIITTVPTVGTSLRQNSRDRRRRSP